MEFINVMPTQQTTKLPTLPLYLNLVKTLRPKILVLNLGNQVETGVFDSQLYKAQLFRR